MIKHLHLKIVQNFSSRAPAVTLLFCAVFLLLLGWPVSFSIGAATCIKVPSKVDDVIRHADELMYAVKHNGKNRLLHKEIGEVTHG